MTDCGELTDRQREIRFAVPEESGTPIEDGDVERIIDAIRWIDGYGRIGTGYAFAGYLDFAINGLMATTHRRMEYGPKRLRITIEADSEEDLEEWRQYDVTGDWIVDEGFAGRWELVVQDGGEPDFVQTSVDHMPPLAHDEWAVESYTERELGTGRYRVSIDYHRAAPREPEYPTLDQSGEWTIDTDRGSIGLGTRRVGQIERTGTSAGGDLSLPVYLTDDQAAVIADAATVPDAVVDREVRGGENFAEDASDGRQTIDVDPPAGAAIDAGAYLVRDWTLERWAREGARWRVELELARPRE